MIELGRIDIMNELLLIHVWHCPEGYLEASVHIVAQMGQKYIFRLVYNPTYQEIDHSVFNQCDLTKFYFYYSEAIPVNAKELWGMEVDVCMFVDSDFYGRWEILQTKKWILVTD